MMKKANRRFWLIGLASAILLIIFCAALFLNTGMQTPEYTWKEHVKVIGQPDLSYPELTPMEIDEAWLSSANKADAAFFVKINDAEFVEADGLTQYAPEAEGDGGNGVNRTLKVGNTNIPFRTSTYANFSTEYMKMGKVDVTGLLTQYNGEWQLTVRTSRDIQ